MREEKYGEGQEQFVIHRTTSPVRHGGGRFWGCMTANETGSIDDMTAEKSIRINSEVYRAILSV